MPQHISAYVYIMIMATVVFKVLEKPITASLMTLVDFKRRRNVWYGITSAAFLSHNYWVYAAVSAFIVLYALQRERNPVAMYFTVLFVIPMFEMRVPGFGIINYITELTHPRLLALTILLPVAFRLVQTREPSSRLHAVIHPVILAYMLTVVTLTVPYVTTANGFRLVIDVVLGIWLPYYVVSRSLHDIRQLREAITMLMLAMCLMGAFAAFEALRGWLMFESLRSALDTPPAMLTPYTLRASEGGGSLRAVVTAGHAIVLGYLMGLGLCFWGAMRVALQPMRYALFALGLLLLGFGASLSRGPWVSAAGGVLLMTLIGPGFFRRLGRVTLVSVVGVVALSFTKFGQTLYAYLPFVGSVEGESVDYRVRLVEVSMALFRDNPILGNFKYLSDPRLEQMRQGQGIIDMVNSYLGIAMAYGLLGLALFVIPFVVSIFMVGGVSRKVESRHASMGITGRAVFGALVTTLLLMATASSTEYIPVVYWSLLGLSSAYVAIAVRYQQSLRVSAERAARSRPVAPRPVTVPHAAGWRQRGRPADLPTTR